MMIWKKERTEVQLEIKTKCIFKKYKNYVLI
jgi:hypothetical protein